MAVLSSAVVSGVRGGGLDNWMGRPPATASLGVEAVARSCRCAVWAWRALAKGKAVGGVELLERGFGHHCR